MLRRVWCQRSAADALLRAAAQDFEDPLKTHAPATPEMEGAVWAPHWCARRTTQPRRKAPARTEGAAAAGAGRVGRYDLIPLVCKSSPSPPSLLLPLPVSLLYTHSLTPSQVVPLAHRTPQGCPPHAYPRQSRARPRVRQPAHRPRSPRQGAGTLGTPRPAGEAPRSQRRSRAVRSS